MAPGVKMGAWFNLWSSCGSMGFGEGNPKPTRKFTLARSSSLRVGAPPFPPAFFHAPIERATTCLSGRTLALLGR